jgi:hypothetical protein
MLSETAGRNVYRVAGFPGPLKAAANDMAIVYADAQTGVDSSAQSFHETSRFGESAAGRAPA